MSFNYDLFVINMGVRDIAASFSHVFEDADEYGWGKVSDRVDWHQFMAAKDRAIARLSLLHID
jgi:glutathione reductase (NADPH)